MRSHGIVFITSNFTHVILDLIPDGVSAPISDIMCRTYGLLTLATPCAFEGSGDGLQVRFNAQEMGAYL